MTNVNPKLAAVRLGAALCIAVYARAHGSVVCPRLIERSVTVVPTAFVSTTKLYIAIPKDNMPVMVISSIGIARLNSTSDWPRLLPAAGRLHLDSFIQPHTLRNI